MPRRAILAVLLVMIGGGRLTAQDSLLARARKQAAAGDYRGAAESYERLLVHRRDDPVVLGGLADALEAGGRWQAAIPVLDRLLRVRPEDASRLRQRGLYAAWNGDRTVALAHLREAARLRGQDPGFLLPLAEVLSWDPATRPEALATFEQAIRLDSTRVEVLAAYGEVLSWAADRRDRAQVLFEQALAQSPRNLQARTGVANLTAWRGDPAAALREYDAILRDSIDYLPALRGKATALNQLGQPREARKVLTRALAVSSDDPGTVLEMARAEFALRRFSAAGQWLVRLNGSAGAGDRILRDSLRRALGSSGEIEGRIRSRRHQLDANLLGLRTSAAVTPSLRLNGGFEAIEYREARADRLQSLGYGFGLEWRGPVVGLSANGRVRTVDSLTTQWDGIVSLRLDASAGVRLAGGWSRTPVEETRTSVLAGVHANLVAMTLELSDLPGPFDARLGLLGGDYSAAGLERNRRLGAEAELGAALRRSQPWLRIGYAVFTTGFEHDADTARAPVPERRGGYFSPDQYWLNQGVAQLGHRFGSRVLLELDGRLGWESVRFLSDGPRDGRAAGGVLAHLTWRLSSGVDLDFRYLYANAFDAFELREGRVLVKGYLK